jgi:hypothetical protein
MSNEERFKESHIPNTPGELLAMQKNQSKLDKEMSKNVKKVIALIDELETGAEEDQHIALLLVARLEFFHDYMVNVLIEEGDNKPEDVCGWAIDADRLTQCRQLLESVADFDLIED